MNMNRCIQSRIANLRSLMQLKGISAFIVPSTDPHSGEYVPEYWETRKWISGFTGSTGTVVITLNNAGLWTDSRYFLQAEEQLRGTNITLFKDKLPETPSIAQWLQSVLPTQSIVGIDGWVNTTAETLHFQRQLNEFNLCLISIEDPFLEFWTDRPQIPTNQPFILPLKYSGVSCTDKITQIRESLHYYHTDGILISALDEIAWTLNLRGTDIHCNPVFVSYLLITSNETVLYIYKEKLSLEVQLYLREHKIQTKEYTEVKTDLCAFAGKCIQLPATTNYALYEAASKHVQVVCEPSPVMHLKAIKNKTEIKGFHIAMRKDGIAMVKFLMWLKRIVRKGEETEISIGQKLYQFRSEQTNFKGTSFNTIAGYQEHGAIVHYEATERNAATLKPEGILLLDSGAQYLEGTTDITRTIVLGSLTSEQKRDYTLVLKGMIALSSISFPHGTCGSQLDVLARQFMWGSGINYGHGTGHGVGHFLNVHEGPHQFRMNYVPALLLPGMTITNEPGIYKSGRYGIRIENTMLVVKDQETEFGVFYKFEPLTLCPIDKEAIVEDMLTDTEKGWLNQYHQTVYNELSPLLSEEEANWLKIATQKI